MWPRKRSEDDFKAEIEAHIQLEADRLRAEGMSERDAFAAARRAFGNPTRTTEDYHDRTRCLWWDQLRQDLRYAMRTLIRAPGFTLAAIITLALGIGANTAMFSVIDSVLIKGLPYPDADRIVAVWGRSETDDKNSFSGADFLELRAQVRSFEHLAAFREASFNVTGQDRPERVKGAVATPDFFLVLRTPPMLGRTLAPELDKPGAERTAVLSYKFWRRRFADDPNVLGQALIIDGEPVTVAGVMPPEFQFPADAELWTAARYAVPEHTLRPSIDQSDIRDSHYFSAIGRLRPGVTLEQARAETNLVVRRQKEQYKDAEDNIGANILSLHDDLVGNTRPALLLLFGAVAVLLLIACANVANIMLARGASRRREITIRGALGAGRSRLIRQLLTETMLLALAGGALGIIVGYLGLTPLEAMVPEELIGNSALQLDWQVLVFTLILSLASGILFGLVPAVQLATPDLNRVLKDGGRGSASGSRAVRARSVLVVSEIALAAVLLIAAGLLIRTFNRLLAVPAGFNSQGVLTAQLSPPSSVYSKPLDRAQLIERVLEKVNSLPGVTSAGVISRLPLRQGASTRSIEIEGRTLGHNEISPDYLVVSPGYFRTMGIPLVSGRAFTTADAGNAPRVVIVSEAMARHFWPEQDAIGKHIRAGRCGDSEKDWCEVVGVVKDIQQHSLKQEPLPAVYVPYAADPWPFMTLAVRTATDPASAVSAVTSAIQAVDKDLPVFGIHTMNDVVAASLSPARFRTLLLGLFAALALVLACVGIYGIMAYSVAQRRQEIGVRMALGADANDVRRLVVRQGAKLAIAGLIVGIALSVPVAHFMQSFLFGVQPTDLATLCGISSLLFGTAIIAAYIPAVRATRVDPITALRE